MQKDKTIWTTLEQVYGFIGNSLLSPMTQTSDLGISADFWNSFPEIPAAHAQAGISKLASYAAGAANMEHDKAVERCAVEYTKLFIGPPSPAAPPWETMNKEGSGSVGFGQATFDMKDRLREAGLEVKNENNQYADHMGIELLYLSVMCGRVAQRDTSDDERSSSITDMCNFIQEHPLAWIEVFRQKIDEAYPEGYFSGLVELAQGVLEWQVELGDQSLS